MEPSSYLCSFPKSGRTWMRFALAQLMNDVYGLDQQFDLKNMFSLIPNLDVDAAQPGKSIAEYRFADNTEVPMIVMSHRPWEELFSSPPVVFLVRNPADTLVSRYWHLHSHQGRFDGSMDEYVRSPHGAQEILDYLSSWSGHTDDSNVLTVTYEQLRSDPLPVFRGLVAHLGIEATESQLEDALEASSVDRMRAIEKKVGVGEPHAYDRNDPQALRVRKAEVGGFKKEMAPETFDYLMDQINQRPEVIEMLNRLEITPER